MTTIYGGKATIVIDGKEIKPTLDVVACSNVNRQFARGNYSGSIEMKIESGANNLYWLIFGHIKNTISRRHFKKWAKRNMRGNYVN